MTLIINVVQCLAMPNIELHVILTAGKNLIVWRCASLSYGEMLHFVQHENALRRSSRVLFNVTMVYDQP